MSDNSKIGLSLWGVIQKQPFCVLLVLKEGLNGQLWSNSTLRLGQT